MRRLARILVTALTALSLLLCVAACVLWVRSHTSFDRFTAERASTYAVYSRDGSLILERATTLASGPIPGPVVPRRGNWLLGHTAERAHDSAFLGGGAFWFREFGGEAGVSFETGPGGVRTSPIEYTDGVRITRLKFPCWCPVACLAILP